MKNNNACRHPVPIRAWHWFHAFFVLALIVTGLPLWNPGLHILPYDSAAVAHRYLGFLLTGSFVFWVVYYSMSGRILRDYVPTVEDFRTLPKQLFLYLFSSPKEHRVPPGVPCSRFGPMQKIVYLCIMTIAVPVSIGTGIMMSDSEQIFLALSIDDIERLYAAHRVSGYILFLFLIVHTYAATLHRPWWSRYRAMITGYEEGNQPDSSTG